MTTDDTIVGLDPTGSPASGHRAAGRRAPRPSSLDGAVVGLISNQKCRATSLLSRVFDELARSHRLGGPVLVTKETVSSPPTAEEWRRLENEAAVAITGYGG
jgi:hypothetical protein